MRRHSGCFECNCQETGSCVPSRSLWLRSSRVLDGRWRRPNARWTRLELQGGGKVRKGRYSWPTKASDANGRERRERTPSDGASELASVHPHRVLASLRASSTQRSPGKTNAGCSSRRFNQHEWTVAGRNQGCQEQVNERQPGPAPQPLRRSARLPRCVEPDAVWCTRPFSRPRPRRSSARRPFA